LKWMFGNSGWILPWKCVYWILSNQDPNISKHKNWPKGSLSMVHHGASCRGFHEKSWEWVQSVSGCCGFNGFRSCPISKCQLDQPANRMFEYHLRKAEPLAIAHPVQYICLILFNVQKISKVECPLSDEGLFASPWRRRCDFSKSAGESRQLNTWRCSAMQREHSPIPSPNTRLPHNMIH
jgi:hypothetical protein